MRKAAAYHSLFMVFMQKQLVTIIVPCYNEAQNIPMLVEQIEHIWESLRDRYDYELLFVNDGSRDGTTALLSDLQRKDFRIHYIELFRNFGKEIALTAGIHHARGDAVLLIDADLQHPVALIPRFIEKWQEGAEMVVGIRSDNKGQNPIQKLFSKLFYSFTSLAGARYILANTTDFRLLDKKVVQEFNRLTERNRITRGLLDWFGFKTEYIYFVADKRRFGKPGYGYLKLLKLAASTFVSHSLLPLKITGYLGILITLVSGFMGLAILVGKYIFHDRYFSSFTGPAQLAILLVFLVGIILTALGLLALYIANIHAEVVNRPMYVVRHKQMS